MKTQIRMNCFESNSSSMHSIVTSKTTGMYTPEEFARETIEHWDEYEGLCRQPTDEEIEAWLERHNVK